MSDELYHADVLVWSERQAERLRRVAHGERVNDVDWEHVIEEIEDVGIAELHAVQSLLQQAIVHVLEVYGWPAHADRNHWRVEVGGFLADAERRFAPSMRQRIDLASIYARAAKQLRSIDLDGPARPLPTVCPFELDELLSGDREKLELRLEAAEPA